MAKKGAVKKQGHLLGGTTGGLVGRCVDLQARAGIPNAKVLAVSPSQTAQTFTDAQGNFNFMILAPDAYTVAAEKAGYDPVSQSDITVYPDQAQTANLWMQKSLQRS